MEPILAVLLTALVCLVLAALAIYSHWRYTRNSNLIRDMAGACTKLEATCAGLSTRIDALVPVEAKLHKVEELQVERVRVMAEGVAALNRNVTAVSQAVEKLAGVIAAPPPPQEPAEQPRRRVSDYYTEPTDADKQRQFRISMHMRESGLSRSEAEALADAEVAHANLFPDASAVSAEV